MWHTKIHDGGDRYMNKTTLLRFLAALGSSALFAAPALADIIVIPPPDSPCAETAAYDNHGDYVSCVAHHPELWGLKGNSDAGQSAIGQ